MNAAREKVEREGVCRVCGDGPAAKLEAAHLVPRSVSKSAFESPELVVPLCGRFGCFAHQRFDGHQLDLLPFVTYEEQAAMVERVGIMRAFKILTGAFPT